MTSIPPTTDTITIELTKGYVTIIDAVDADLAELAWCVLDTHQNTPYAYRGILKPNGKWSNESLHRVILSRMVGRFLKRHEHTDHINGDSLDNRRSNLRLASQAQNLRNQRIRADNTSGYKGVCWHKQHKKWIAGITVDSKRIHLGYFDTPEAAYAAYCDAAKRLHGEFHNLG